MPNYRLSNVAKEDLIRIHQYGVQKFGLRQADKYFNEFFTHFARIAEAPFSYRSVDHIRRGYRMCPCGSDTIYFRIGEENIEIMAIVGRQDINEILKTS